MLRTALGVSVGWLGISMVSDGVPALLLPHRLVSEGQADATTLGLTTLVAIAASALVQPFAGRWSDRVGRFPVILAGAMLGAAGLALTLAPGMALVGTVVTLAGVSIAQAGHQALLPDRLGAGWRGRAGGLKSAFDVGGAFLAFLLLAALLGGGRPEVAAGVLAVVLVAGFAASRALLPGEPPRGRPSAPMRAVFRLDMAAHRPLVLLILARFLFLLGIYVVGRFLLLFVAQQLGLGADAAAEETGLALALLAGITVVASLPSGWLADRVGRRPLMLAGGLVAGVGTVLLPTADATLPILVFGGLMALGSAAFGAASWAMLADLAHAPDAGRLLGLAHIGTAAAAAAAGAFGILLDATGFGLTFGLAAACSIAGGVLGWRTGESPRPAEAFLGTPEASRS